MLGTAAWWLLAVTRGWAGRDPKVVSVGALLVALSVVLARPSRVLPPAVTAVTILGSAGALAVAVFSPTGWAGVSVGASYVCALWLATAVAATIRRRPAALETLAALVVVAGCVEYAEGWLPWWGGGNPGHPMIGTFYWHDPFAAFLLPAALLGLWLWIWRRRVPALLGLLGFTLCSTGVLYSTSRAALGCLVIGAVATLAMALAGSERLRATGRGIGAVAVAAAASYLVAGPPFFSHRVTAAGAIQGRTAGQSLGQNGGYRLQFWHEALSAFGRHPVTGGGYHSLASESVGHVPSGWAISPFAHNGFLQPLADGGLLLGLPFLLACTAVALVTLRLLMTAARRRTPSLAGFGVPLALGLVMVHSAVDFDWTYAADLALFGILAGAAVGASLAAGRSPAPGPSSASAPSPAPADEVTARRRAAAGVLAAVLLLCVSAWAARNGDLHESLPLRHAAAVVKAPAIPADSR